MRKSPSIDPTVLPTKTARKASTCAAGQWVRLARVSALAWLRTSLRAEGSSGASCGDAPYFFLCEDPRPLPPKKIMIPSRYPM